MSKDGRDLNSMRNSLFYGTALYAFKLSAAKLVIVIAQDIQSRPIKVRDLHQNESWKISAIL